jgi:hypothetical protein
MRSLRLGSGSAYWGDLMEPAVELAERGELDYLCFDHLAELTLSILQRQRSKDPSRGYITDITPWMEAILPIARRNGTRLITNAGGANPAAAAEQVIRIARKHGLAGTRVAVVTGDDVHETMLRLNDAGHTFRNMDTGEEDLGRIRDRIVAANAYIGAEGIVEGLARDAHVVVTGRASDNALYVGPLMHEFGWTFDDVERMGAAVTIGHILECAALANGSLSNFWREAQPLSRVGFPFADIFENGEAIVSKLDGTGGLVTEMTIKEQLLYEIHDPKRYLMPDAIADFTAPRLEQVGKDKVRVTGMTGIERPETLKVCIGFEDGWIGEGVAMFSWPEAYDKALAGERIVRERLEMLGVQPREIVFELLGINTLHGPTAPMPDHDLNEVGLRVAAHCETLADAEVVRREILHLWTLGGVGSAIMPPGRPRPVTSLWPTLIPRDAVDVHVDVLEA